MFQGIPKYFEWRLCSFSSQRGRSIEMGGIQKGEWAIVHLTGQMEILIKCKSSIFCYSKQLFLKGKKIPWPLQAISIEPVGAAYQISWSVRRSSSVAGEDLAIALQWKPQWSSPVSRRKAAVFIGHLYSKSVQMSVNMNSSATDLTG